VLHTAPAQHDAAADYDAFLEKLPKDDCVWGVYDFEFTKGDEGKRNKICFISWCVRRAAREASVAVGWMADGEAMEEKGAAAGRVCRAGTAAPLAHRAGCGAFHAASACHSLRTPHVASRTALLAPRVSHLAHCASLTPSRRVQGAG